MMPTDKKVTIDALELAQALIALLGHGRALIAWAAVSLVLVLADGTVGIVTILHERMHQIERFRDDLS